MSNDAFLEHLKQLHASQGYIIFATNYPHNAGDLVKPDARANDTVEKMLLKEQRWIVLGQTSREEFAAQAQIEPHKIDWPLFYRVQALD